MGFGIFLAILWAAGYAMYRVHMANEAKAEEIRIARKVLADYEAKQKILRRWPGVGQFINASIFKE